MSKFEINQAVSGVDLGVFNGKTKDQALDAMAQDQGYADYDELLSVTGETRESDTLEIREVRKPLTFSVVVRDCNSWDAKTGIHCLLRDCGHAHRSLATASHCHAKLTKVTGQWGNGGTTSAAWFNAVVESSTGEQFSNCELFEALNQ